MTFEEKSKPEERASIRLLLAVLLSAALIAVVTVDMVTPVMPLIGEEFGASEANLVWVVTGVSLTLAIGVPLYGRISDFFGIRKLFCLALVAFAAGCLVCALAPSLTILVAGRMLQGVGSAAIPVLAMVAISRNLPPGERGGALGLVASTIGVGAAVGPVFGGVFGEIFGWTSLFWVTMVSSLALVPVALRAIPDETPDADYVGSRRFDVAGGAFLGLAAGLFLFGVTRGQVEGFTAFSSWGSILGATVSAVCLIWRVRRAEDPFVPPALFANRVYVATLTIAFFSMTAYLASLVFVPLFVVEINGLTPFAAGLVLLPGGVAVALLSPLAGEISDRTGASFPIVVGLSVMGISTLFISTFAVGASPVLASLGIMGMGVGNAFIQPPANNAVAGMLPKDQVSVGLGILQGALFLGAGAGPALLGALLAARRGAEDSLNPLYALDEIPYSDAFLTMTVAVAFALAATLGLRRVPRDFSEGA